MRGESIYAFVTLKSDHKETATLKKELIEQVRRVIGPIATPEYIQFAQALPKTRSGKIMRRILRKIVNGEIEKLGDISTLANPETVQAIIAEVQGK